MTDEEKKAMVELNHFSNMTAYWKQEEYTNSEIDNYIKIVLNLIEKQQKEIKELNLKNEKLYEDNLTLAQEIKEFIEGTNDVKYYSTSFIKNHYISKDKIKAKIEEVSNGTYDAKIVLQSLLKEE